MSDVRVIQLADYGGSYPGSFVPMLTAALDAAGAQGWRAEAVFSAGATQRPWRERMAESGYTTRLAPGGSARETGAWLAELLAESDARTILHTHFTRFDLPAIIAARSRPGTIVFWHLHTFLAPAIGARLRNAIKFALLARRTNGMICAGEWLGATARRRGAPSSRVIVLPNGIDASRFPIADETARNAARASLGLPVTSPVLLHFAWNWSAKGGDLFLATLRKLREAGTDVRALIVGSESRAKAERDRLGLTDAVHVIGARDRVDLLYAACDAFVSTSRAEGGGPPFAILEALASGRPVVATDIPAHRSIPASLDTYQLAAPRPEALAAAIASLIGRESAARSGEGAAAWVRDQMGVENWAERVLAIYTEALSRAK